MSGILLEVQALAGRWFIHSKRRPMVVLAGLFQPFIWLVLFATVFKNSPMRAQLGSDSYLAFITPGALVFTAFSGALNGGVPILFDRELGFLDRLLVAPLHSRFSIIWATGLHIFVMSLLQCGVIVLLTSLMGVEFQGGITGVFLVLLVLGLVTLLFTTFSLILAFILRYHFELLSIILIISLPLVFISTAFAPVAYMPKWLTYLVSVNPITLAVEPLRAVYQQATWQFSGPIFSSAFGAFSMQTCLIILVILNFMAALAARKIIRRRLS